MSARYDEARRARIHAAVDALIDALLDSVEPTYPSPASIAPASLIDKRELARALNVSVATVDRLDREGQPFLRIGDAKRYDLASVLAWHRERPVQLADQPASSAVPIPESGVRRLSRRRQ